MASPEETGSAELGVSRSGRVRKKSSRLLDIGDDVDAIDNVEPIESAKISKSKRKSKSDDYQDVPVSPPTSKSTSLKMMLQSTPSGDGSGSARKSRKRQHESDSQLSEVSEVEDFSASAKKKSKKAVKEQEHEDLKIKLHLGSSPHVEKVTSPTTETPGRAASKRKKKSLSQSSETFEQETPAKEGGLKLKLLLTPPKAAGDDEELESDTKTKKNVKKKGKTKGKIEEYGLPSEGAVEAELPTSPVEMSYEQFVEAIQEENSSKKASKKKKPEVPSEPKGKKKKKSKGPLEDMVELEALDPDLEDDVWPDPADEYDPEVEAHEEMFGEGMDPHMDTDEFDQDFSQDESSHSIHDTSKAAANFFQNKSGKKPKVPKVPKVKGEKKVKEKKRQRNRAPTAYTVWCSTYRSKVVAQNPGIDFAQTSKRLGEIWQALPEKEKVAWRKKAKKQTKKVSSKGSTLITTGKHSGSKLMSTKKRDPSSAPKPVASKTVASPEIEADVHQVTDTSPLNAAAHLKLLGESLSLIGSRLIDHRGQIAVQGSLSVMLDSMLCAMGPLVTLLEQIPELTTERTSEVNAKTLDHLAYIMPGL